MMDFFWLRHGPSDWNLERRWQGQQNPELSKEGALLAKKWAEQVLKTNNAFKCIWSSDLLRASQTAEIAAQTLRIGLSLDERLRERKLGAWEGLTREEIDKGWPGAIEKRQFPEGSEQDDEVIERVLDFLQERFFNVPSPVPSLGSDPNQKAPVLIVAHGGVITCVEEHLGARWQRLHNLTGRWISCRAPYNAKALFLGERVNYLGADPSSPSSSASDSDSL